MSKEYTVATVEKWIQHVKVTADSEEEAIEKVKAGECDIDTDCYSEALGLDYDDIAAFTIVREGERA
jgi:hypothetical protein